MRSLVGIVVLSLSLTTAGSVARQALGLGPHGPVVGWTCPACGEANAGEPAARLQASCRHCSGHFAWTEVVAPDRLAEGSAAR